MHNSRHAQHTGRSGAVSRCRARRADDARAGQRDSCNRGPLHTARTRPTERGRAPHAAPAGSLTLCGSHAFRVHLPEHACIRSTKQHAAILRRRCSGRQLLGTVVGASICGIASRAAPSSAGRGPFTAGVDPSELRTTPPPLCSQRRPRERRQGHRKDTRCRAAGSASLLRPNAARSHTAYPAASRNDQCPRTRGCGAGGRVGRHHVLGVGGHVVTAAEEAPLPGHRGPGDRGLQLARRRTHRVRYPGQHSRSVRGLFFLLFFFRGGFFFFSFPRTLHELRAQRPSPIMAERDRENASPRGA